MRGVLILTCTGVSFAHGTNDGQKSIGLIMLTLIGLFPAVFALNPMAAQSLADLPKIVRQAEPLIEKYGDDQKESALKAAKGLEGWPAGPRHRLRLSRSLSSTKVKAAASGVSSETAKERSGVRDNIYKLIAQLKHVEEAKGASSDDKKQAKSLSKQLRAPVEYAP